jgi:poly(3-hydroxybutyrate) depolymerase
MRPPRRARSRSAAGRRPDAHRARARAAEGRGAAGAADPPLRDRHRARDGEGSPLSRLADRKGFIAVYPTAGHSNGFWNVTRSPAQPDDVQFMRDLIGALPAHVCADLRRVSATGVSNGASMTGVLGCAMADRLAAIAPVSTR